MHLTAQKVGGGRAGKCCLVSLLVAFEFWNPVVEPRLGEVGEAASAVGVPVATMDLHDFWATWKCLESLA